MIILISIQQEDFGLPWDLSAQSPHRSFPIDLTRNNPVQALRALADELERREQYFEGIPD